MVDKEEWVVCPVCEGEGTTVNPDIDANGLTHEDFEDDPDFAEDYKAGAFNVRCRGCDGRRVVKPKRIEELAQNAEDRRMAARENGDFESYSVASDWRYG